MEINKKPLQACVWEYSLNENDIYDILTNKYVEKSPLTREQLIHKMFRYMNFEKIMSIFSKEEILDMVKNIKIDFIRNENNKIKIKELINE